MNKFEKVIRCAHLDFPLPTRSTADAAGYDFVVVEDTIVPSILKLRNQMQNAKWEILSDPVIPLTLDEVSKITKALKTKPTLVPTGVKCQINEGWYLKLAVRSSLPLKHWLILANGEGIIDKDYYGNPDNEGEIFFQLINLSPFDILLKAGDKIGQGVFVPYGLVEKDKYGEGEKRKGGFGSTSEYISVPHIIDDIETTIPIEPKYTTTTTVETDDYYQITLNDIRTGLL